MSNKGTGFVACIRKHFHASLDSQQLKADTLEKFDSAVKLAIDELYKKGVWTKKKKKGSVDKWKSRKTAIPEQPVIDDSDMSCPWD